MIGLFDNSHELSVCEAESGLVAGQLLTPLTCYRNRAKEEGRPWAVENGAYSGLKIDAFLSLLEREKPDRKGCIFVTAPDVVGNARRTLEVFHQWYPKLCMWPVALVAQDGQEDLPIPWHSIAAIFVGGSTQWKMSKHALDICRAARAIGKHIHIGRVNTADRLQHFEGLADSIDGTGISRYTHMRKALAADEPKLFLKSGMEAVA